MKKNISILLICILVINLFGNIAFAEDDKLVEVKEFALQKLVEVVESFKDTANHWAKNLIAKLIDKGAINGYLDGSFRPDNSIKVGEFTKILVGSLGYDDLGNSTEGHWSLNYVNKAKELGLILEDEFTTSDLERNISRGEMARMIARAINEEYPSNLAEYKSLIKDYDEIPAQYQEYILKAFAKGIITGYEDGSFKYDKSATRAEASTMIVRLLDESERKPVSIEDEALDDESQENISDNIKDTKFWKEGIKAAKEYLSSRDDIQTGEVMEKEHYFGINDVDVAFRVGYGYMSDVHNYDYSEDYSEHLDEVNENYAYRAYSEEEREIYRQAFGTPYTGIVEPYFEQFARENANIESIFVSDKNSLFWGEDTFLALRGRLYFKFLNREKPESIESFVKKGEYRLYKEIFGEYSSTNTNQWYYTNVNLEVGTKVISINKQNYYFFIQSFPQDATKPKKVTDDIREELESFIK